MSQVFLPPMKPLQGNATPAERHAAYWEYVDELVRHNHHCFLPIGVRKRWWHWRIEHPRTETSDE